MDAAQAAAFEDVIATHGKKLYRIALRKSRSPQDAEDALQDAFLSAYKHLDDFQGKAKLSSWLTRIVINSALGRLRQGAAHPATSLEQTTAAGVEFADPGLSPEKACAQRERRALLEDLLQRLPVAWRSAVRLREIEGLSTREAARALGIPEATLKTRLHRARARLALCLRAQGVLSPAI